MDWTTPGLAIKGPAPPSHTLALDGLRPGCGPEKITPAPLWQKKMGGRRDRMGTWRASMGAGGCDGRIQVPRGFDRI